MTNLIDVLDPTYEEQAASLVAAPRLDTLAGATIGVISNGKQGTGRFFDAVRDHLIHAYDAADVEIVVKPNYSAPAGDNIFDAARHWQAVIAGIGD